MDAATARSASMLPLLQVIRLAVSKEIRGDEMKPILRLKMVKENEFGYKNEQS